MKHQIKFKDPDLIWNLINAKHPMPDNEDDWTPRLEKQRDKFSDTYFEYGDYGRIEIDALTLSCRLLPKKEWK